MKALDVPLYKQTETTCGPTSIRMVLAYYGISKPLSAIVRATDSSKTLGTCIGEIGRQLIRNGFDAGIIGWYPEFPLRFRDLPHESLDIYRWACRKAEPKRDRRSLTRFLEEDGAFVPRPVQLDDLIESIDAGDPPIINFSPGYLYADASTLLGHYAPVVAADKKKVVLNDPYVGRVEHDSDQVIFACHSWSAASAIFPIPRT